MSKIRVPSSHQRDWRDLSEFDDVDDVQFEKLRHHSHTAYEAGPRKAPRRKESLRRGFSDEFDS